MAPPRGVGALVEQGSAATRAWRDVSGFLLYFLACCAACGAVAASAVVAWSDMGWGEECLEFVRGRHGLLGLFAAIALGILVALYVLDFFVPPHLPGRYCVLFDGDVCVGWALVSCASLASVAACLLLADVYPSIPTILHTLLGPLLVAGIRGVLILRRHGTLFIETEESFSSKEVGTLTPCGQVARDQNQFYCAATAVFMMTGIVCLSLWVPWALVEVPGQRPPGAAQDERELQVSYIMWANPLVFAVSNIMYGLVSMLRLCVNSTYNAMDELSEAHMRYVANFIKVLGCVLFFKFGATYIACQLVAADSHIALMVQGIIGALFLAYVTFVLCAFRRLWNSMREYLVRMPLWHKALDVSRSDWLRAGLLGVLLPLLPIGMLLSFANQRVRVLRGIHSRPRRMSFYLPTGMDTGMDTWQKAPSATCFTERVHEQLGFMRDWDWASIILRGYVLGYAFTVMLLTPRLTDICLAWASNTFRDLDFTTLIVVTFFIGLGMFLMPPVPGAPIYFFAGIMFTQTCPWGFWWGALASVIMSWCLKLTACALQQKVIGERLGTYMWVQQNIGVHTSFIRTVASVLRKPGMSMGKVAILCGGPDWPTSVMAGILRLPLFQMELGTTPIVFFIAPFSLSGSFYLRREDSDFWMRSANLMFTVTALVWIALYVLMAWAWQVEYEANHDLVTRPMEEYVHLDWLDRCSGRVRDACEVTLEVVPRPVRAAYAGGAACVALVNHLFWWRTHWCFGSFAITDDTATLKWYGQDGLFKPLGLVGLTLLAASLSGLVALRRWRARRFRAVIRSTELELKAQESAWKERRIADIRSRGEAGPPPPPSDQSSEPPSEASAQYLGTVLPVPGPGPHAAPLDSCGAPAPDAEPASQHRHCPSPGAPKAKRRGRPHVGSWLFGAPCGGGCVGRLFDPVQVGMPLGTRGADAAKREPGSPARRQG